MHSMTVYMIIDHNFQAIIMVIIYEILVFIDNIFHAYLILCSMFMPPRFKQNWAV